MIKKIKSFIRKHSLRICSIVSAIALVTFLVLSIVGSFSDNKALKSISVVFLNPYLSGTACAVCLIFIVFDIQICISKKRIKKDFRCNEIMEAIYDAIVDYKK